MSARFFRPLRWGIILASLLAIGAVISGCGGAQEEGAQEEGSPGPIAGSFVGDVSEPVASVAVVAAEPEEGEDAREVRALIYGDSENWIVEWFTGSAEGNTLELTSEDGARFDGELTPEGATGMITLPDETEIPVEAAPANGVAGFYEVTVLDDGQVNGVSETGARMEGELAEEPSEGDVYPINGTITPPEGEPQDFETPFLFPGKPPEEALPADARFIVSLDGIIRGGARKSSSSQFTDLLID